MFQRLVCRCPLCQLEKSIISRLEEEDSLHWFANLRIRVPSIGTFGGTPELILCAHRAGQDVDKRRICDDIYTALLRQLASSENTDLLQGLLVRMLIPGLHRVLTGIAVSFPGLSREELTQQLITICLQLLRSPGILRKTSYVGASIIERTKRNTIRWAIRQYRDADREETSIVIDELIETSSSLSFEAEIHLRHLLDRSVESGLISVEEMTLLIAYEIEGWSGEELGKREGLAPKALSHRVRRALDRLNRSLQKTHRPSKTPSKEPSE
jgi:DNA-directed RNA polymerase specialized sigma24 family protein